MKEKPLVSVIVPNLNNRRRLQKCLDGLLAQTYPKKDFEIIVIDNGSSDGSLELIKEYPVQFLQVTNIQSPYVCRNRGIEVARGGVIVLLDAKCSPVPDFLSSGAKMLTERSLDVVIGNIVFEFSTPPTAVEWVDRILFAHGEEIVAFRKNFPAGALFIKRILFDQFGLFLNLRSGGDSEWSARVFEAGKLVGYASEAVVYYPAADYAALMKKARRFGKGAKHLYQEKNGAIPLTWRLKHCLHFLPPNPFKLLNRIKKHRYSIPTRQLILIWLFLWQFKITRAIEVIFR